MNGISFFMILIGIGGLLLIHYWLSSAAPDAEQNPPSPDSLEDEPADGLSQKIERLMNYPGKLLSEFVAYIVRTNLTLPNDAAAPAPKKRLPELSDAGLRDLIQYGKIDEAVNAYRVVAGVDLYSAQDAIREIQREMHLTDDAPHSFAPQDDKAIRNERKT